MHRSAKKGNSSAFVRCHHESEHIQCHRMRTEDMRGSERFDYCFGAVISMILLKVLPNIMKVDQFASHAFRIEKVRSYEIQCTKFTICPIQRYPAVKSCFCQPGGGGLLLPLFRPGAVRHFQAAWGVLFLLTVETFGWSLCSSRSKTVDFSKQTFILGDCIRCFPLLIRCFQQIS